MILQGTIPRADCALGLGGLGKLGFVIPAAWSTAASAAGAPAGAGAAWLGAAGGPIGLAITGAFMGLTALLNRQGPQQRIEATRIVDQIEPFLAQNRDGFLASNRSPENYAVALANFDYAWGEVVAGCSNPALGNPGRVCISERQRGGRWDWFALYRDPIADAGPVEQPGVLDSLLGGGGGGAGGSMLAWLLPAGLVVLALALPD
jgi:hypothetical protein